ncbi:MAG: RasGEF domain-containing protein, partial [archaeon]|nr:RasGEF domain-containing protein [archaeon]
QLPVAELLLGRFSKPRTSPNIRHLTSHFNLVTQVITSSILNRTTLHSRINLVERWISVAESAFKINNYSLLLQVVSSLGSTSISRLKSTWNAIQPKQFKVFTELSGFINPIENYAAYRKAVMVAPLPVMPIIPVFQKDLTFLEDTIRSQFATAVPSVLDSSLPIPWVQISNVGQIAALVARLQKVPFPPHKSVPDFCRLLRSYPILSETEAYEVSTRYDHLRGNLLLEAGVDDPKPYQMTFMTVSVRILFSKDARALIKKQLIRTNPSSVKTINFPIGNPFRDLRAVLLDKIFAFAPKSEEIDTARNEMNAWVFATAQVQLLDDDIIGPAHGELIFKPPSGKLRADPAAALSSLKHQVSILSTQLDDTKITLGREIEQIHSEIAQLKSSFDHLASLLRNTGIVDSSVRI